MYLSHEDFDILLIRRGRLVTISGSFPQAPFCKSSRTLYKAYYLASNNLQGEVSLPGLQEEQGLCGCNLSRFRTCFMETPEKFLDP